ncbi:HNH endonuclease signature motif containing protein [Rothia sp. ZJ1223]|uniref:HNH endonuclease n=1 Tax=Rothia sp. ZJ1223 TaxID=2811098 RepID=UPI00195B0764|nr:HNH endonuclease [Rothia sp. ZJ1223]
MEALAALRVLYAGKLVCHICKQPIIDHRYTLTCCNQPKRLHWLTADHVIPRSKGGTDDLSNLRPAHHRCNSARGNKDITRRHIVEDSTGFFI